MGRYLSGIDGALWCDGSKIARVSGWSISGAVEALETTTLGDSAATYLSGRQNYSGSASVHLYEETLGSLQASVLTGDVLRTNATPHGQKHRLKLSLGDRSIDADVVVTGVELQAAAGAVVTAGISFVVTGHLAGVI